MTVLYFLQTPLRRDRWNETRRCNQNDLANRQKLETNCLAFKRVYFICKLTTSWRRYPEQTSAVFVLVSGKGRYATGSTRNIMLQKEPMSEHKLQEAQPLFRAQHSADQHFANFYGTRRLRRSQDAATGPHPGPCGKKVNKNIWRNRLNLVQPGQGNTGVTEHCNPIFGKNVRTFFRYMENTQ